MHRKVLSKHTVIFVLCLATLHNTLSVSQNLSFIMLFSELLSYLQLPILCLIRVQVMVIINSPRTYGTAQRQRRIRSQLSRAPLESLIR